MALNRASDVSAADWLSQRHLKNYDYDFSRVERQFFSVGEVIYQTRGSVSSDIQTLRSGLKKRGAAEFFLTNIKVFGYLMKHSFECLI